MRGPLLRLIAASPSVIAACASPHAVATVAAPAAVAPAAAVDPAGPVAPVDPTAPAVASGPTHDPDHARGALPTADARRAELATIRKSLDGMYAHRLDKLRRAGLDEDALFAALETQLIAAVTWMQYDAAIYDTLAKFHDGHLTYHPPASAAPARGYDAYRLGLTATLAGAHLLVATVDADSDLAAAGVAAGDEVLAIDGVAVASLLDRAVAGRVWSRPESARSDFARTWTGVLYPKQSAPRTRKLTVQARSGGKSRDVAVTPHPAAGHAEHVASVLDAGVATVTIQSLGGGRDRAAAIDRVLAEARAAKGLVIDLRGDRGGVDAVGYRVVADLVEGTASLGSFRVLVAPETIARRPRWNHLAKLAGPDGFAPAEPLTVAGLPAGAGYRGPVAVVVDASCASTCEVVTAALRADLHAVVFGETTAGSSGAPVEVTLPASRGAIAIPTWNLVAADGHAIESEGVVPDVAVVATPDALAAGDDLPLHAARDSVRARLPP